LSSKPFAQRSRPVVAGVIASLLTASLLFGVATVVAADPKDGPAHDALSFIEERFGYQNQLRYDLHRLLGKVLSVCPCTAGLSREQYRRASFHRPRTVSP
jgi:hypothetical protein